MENIEIVDGAYRIVCPVCQQRIQSEDANGEWEGGFEPCEHLHFSYLEDCGLVHPYDDKQAYKLVEAELEATKLLMVAEQKAEDATKEKGTTWSDEDYLEDIQEDEVILYYAKHLGDDKISYYIEVQSGGCGGGHWKVKNIFVFNK